jgi:hypothetical protein
MSTTILNFKKVELVAASKDEAIAKMEETLFHYNGDATQAYKNWKSKQTKGITERDVKEFMLDYLAKKGKNCPGGGYLITLEASVADTRERPYKIEDVKSEGKRKFKTFYKWIDSETGVVVASVDTNKADAKNVLKELYKSGAYKGNASLVKTKDVVEGEATVATAKYTPSKNTKNGTWLAFGIEA